MKAASVSEVMNNLVSARSLGDIETVVSLYEKNATIVPQPGTILHGESALRGWLAGFIALKPVFSVLSKEIVEGSDIALHLSLWSLTGVGPDGTPVSFSGRSTDVLRKQSDGRWLVAVDNPWGTGLLSEPS